MKKYAVVLLIIFSIFLEAKLKDDYILYLDDHNKAIVIASGLNVRSLPNQKSEVIEMIPRNGIVEITNISKNTDVVNNLKNFWYEIKFSKNSVEPARKGWVFGAYLQILDVSIKKENIKYKNKDILVKRWKRIINTKMQFSKEMKYITDDFEIPIYKTTADIQNKKEFRKIKENYEFYVTDKYYDETSYEMRNYFQFEHPGLGKVWISANYLHCVGDIKKYKDYTIVLCSTEPVIEGDRSDYDLIIYKGDLIVCAINDFKDVGSYAACEIKRIYEENNKMHLELFCEGNMYDRTVFSDDAVDNVYSFVNVIFNTETNEIERVYEDSLF